MFVQEAIKISEPVQSATMLGYLYGTSRQTVFTVWKARHWYKWCTSCFFHWWFFRGFNGVWFWRLSDDFYLILSFILFDTSWKNSWTKLRHTAKFLHLGENGFVHHFDWPFSYATVFFLSPGMHAVIPNIVADCLDSEKKWIFQKMSEFPHFHLPVEKILHARGHLRPTPFHVF